MSKPNKSGPLLPPKVVVINKNEVTSETSISNEFDKLFTIIGPELA